MLIPNDIPITNATLHPLIFLICKESISIVMATAPIIIPLDPQKNHWRPARWTSSRDVSWFTLPPTLQLVRKISTMNPRIIGVMFAQLLNRTIVTLVTD